MFIVPAVSRAMDSEIHHEIDFKTKPLGSLGSIEGLAAQICRVQQTLSPKMETCSLSIFAGDHGVAEEGVSAFPKEVTGQMVLNFLAGGAAANVFSRANGVAVQVIDAGIAGDPIDHPDLVRRRVGPGTRNYLYQPAMASDEANQALRHGVEVGVGMAGEAAAFGEMGIGNTSSASLIAHKLANIPINGIVGRGTGVDDDGLARKREILSAAAARTGDLDAMGALQEYGGFEIVQMAGAMIGAAQTGKIVVVDGFIASVAALAALGLAPNVRDYLVFSHCSAESGHVPLLASMEAQPLLHLDLRLGEGTGAVLAWPLLRAAAAMMNEMASFESAGVSNKD